MSRFAGKSAPVTGLRLHHVNPHCALYTQGLVDAAVAGVILEAIASYNASPVLYASPECELLPAGERTVIGLR